MSWFDGITDALLGNGGQSSILPSLIQTGANVGGNILSQEANEKAAKETQAANAQEAAILQEQRDQGNSGTLALQQQVQRGAQLTPDQQTQLNLTREQTMNALHAGGLSGSGRATVAAVNNVDSNLKSNFMGENQRLANTAATGLSGQSFNAGRELGQNYVSQGGNKGRATLGNSSLMGSSLGDIAGTIAGYTKNQNTSQYSLNRGQMASPAGSQTPQLNTPSSYEAGDGYSSDDNNQNL